MVGVFISFAVGLIAGATIGALLTFRYLDRELLRMGIDVVGHYAFRPPKVSPPACGFESEL